MFFRKRLFNTQNLTLGSILILLLSHFLFGIEREWEGRVSVIDEIKSFQQNVGKPIYTNRPEDAYRYRVPGRSQN